MAYALGRSQVLGCFCLLGRSSRRVGRTLPPFGPTTVVPADQYAVLLYAQVALIGREIFARGDGEWRRSRADLVQTVFQHCEAGSSRRQATRRFARWYRAA